MKIDFTTEQKIIIGINLITVATVLYSYYERKTINMKSNNLAVPEFLKKDTVSKIKEKAMDDITKPVEQYDEQEQIIEDNIIQHEEANSKPSGHLNIVSSIEKEKLQNTVRSMGQEQVMVMLESVPIEMVFNRIGKELERNKAFAKAISNAMSILQ